MTPKQTKEFIELCNHPAIKEKFDGWRNGDNWIMNDGKVRVYHEDNAYDPPEHATWFPSVFPYTDPSRCLWSWVDWDHARICSDDLGDVENVLLWTWLNGFEKEWESMPLPIALAKAIIWKWEQENKK